MLLGVVAGGVAGFVLGADAARWFGWLGKLFLTLLQMTIVPLVVSSIVVGVASLGDPKALGRAGALTLGYYLTTTLIAVTIGMLMAHLWHPGVGVAPAHPLSAPEKPEVSAVDILLSLVHPNIVQAAAEMKLLPLIVFSLALGIALASLGPQGRTAIEVFSGLQEAIMTIVHWIMRIAPLGVMALVASRLGEAGGGEAFTRELVALGRYAGSVLSGLVAHAAVLLTLLWAFARRSPWAYLQEIGTALATAFSTASSSATLPLTMDGVRRAGVSQAARRLVLPIGATINMDGTALYEAAAALFIAQAYGIKLGLYEQILVWITATLAAIGAAGIPEAGLVTMVIVLTAAGLPTEGIGLILAIDWFLDRFRTTVNVLGDTVGAAVIDRWIRR